MLECSGTGNPISMNLRGVDESREKETTPRRLTHAKVVAVANDDN